MTTVSMYEWMKFFSSTDNDGDELIDCWKKLWKHRIENKDRYSLSTDDINQYKALIEKYS